LPVSRLYPNLGEQAYDAAHTEGQTFSFDRTIELALALAAEIQAAETRYPT